MIIKSIEPEEFEEWLQSKPQGAIVGEQGNYCICPLANYLHEMSGRISVTVTSVSWYVSVNSQGEHHQWARDFISAVDTARTENKEITREQALQILGRCT